MRVKTAPNSARSRTGGRKLVRLFGWASLAVLAAFLFNDYLTYWHGWPGASGTNADVADGRKWLQVALYGAAVLGAAVYVRLAIDRPLRQERTLIVCLNSYLIRTVFWAVLLIGIVDFLLAFLRGEDLLIGIVGMEMSQLLHKNQFRGQYIHMTLVGVSAVLAAVTRTIGVTWLSLMIVTSELLLVLSRFVFSYEQDYMADLVRFWFAPLFLAGCAYAMREESHVRIDVLYADLNARSKGFVNAFGSILLGMPFCWLILIVGTSGKTGIINSALLTFEIEGLGNGLYLFYLMTVLMGVFAVTMLIEFIAVLFGAIADIYGEPGGRKHETTNIQ